MWAEGGTSVGWRGDGTGVFAEASVPTEWAKDRNILWKAPLPNWSNASPVIVGNRAFVCYEASGVVCISTTDGKELWSKTNDLKELFTPEEWQQREARVAEYNQLRGKLGQTDKQLRELAQKLRLGTEEGRKADDEKRRKQWENRAEREKKRGKTVEPYKPVDYGPLHAKEELDALKAQVEEVKRQRGELHGKMRSYDDVSPPRLHNVTGYSTPTPLTDGKHVYVQFGTGVVACYDTNGNRKWIRFVGKCPVGSGLSTSGALLPGRLILFGDRLKALNTETGEELWSCREARGAIGSLVLAKIGEEDAVVTAGGDLVLASDGKLIARGLGRLTYASPVVSDGVAYFADPNVIAVELPHNLEEAAKPKRLWAGKIKSERYYASPTVCEDLLYAVNQRGVASAVDLKTGELVWEQQLALGGTVYPSATSAGGHVFISSDNGKTAVIKPGREFELVRMNQLGEGFRSCPVFHNGRLYIRGLKHLYCIGTR